MKDTNLIFGVTGQDGSYLAELIVGKGENVVGVARRTSTPSTGRIEHLLGSRNFTLEEGDVTDYASIHRLIQKYKPYRIYNLAAQSHVGTSFNQAANTFNIVANGPLNILEAIRHTFPTIQYYQASSSEMFGDSVSFYYDVRGSSVYYTGDLDKGDKYCSPYSNRDGDKSVTPTHEMDGIFQDENTRMNPQSPYAIAKLAAYHTTRLYRKSYGIFACNGILFNHESPRRGENFVTRKITKYVGYLHHALDRKDEFIRPLRLGNLDASRDWGHAKDYVAAMIMMMDHSESDDFVIATNETHTVREFVELAFGEIDENWEDWVKIDEELIRPSEVPYLRGDSHKAHSKLGWIPKYSFERLVREMVWADIEMAHKKNFVSAY